ncbi:MAG: hypothetical protein NWS22_04205, partial [Porticoccaceae bacterium]|nr:hypothetical protein [Porticoccaceae bacterium]
LHDFTPINGWSSCSIFTNEIHINTPTIIKGKAQAIVKVSSALMQEVENGSLRAIIFYLKCRAGWREEEPEIKEIPPMMISVHTDATN